MNCFLNWPKIIQEKKNHLIQVSESGVDLLWCSIFCYLELCGARKYIHGQDYVDPPPRNYISYGWGSIGKALYSGGMVMFYVTAHCDIRVLFL